MNSFLLSNKFSRYLFNNINQKYIKSSKLFYCSSVSPSASSAPLLSNNANQHTIVSTPTPTSTNNSKNSEPLLIDHNNSLDNFTQYQHPTFHTLKEIPLETIDQKYRCIKELSPSVAEPASKKKLVNSEKDINIVLYSNKDFQSIIKLFNSTYTASTEFLVQDNLDPLLLKTSKPDEPVKVRNRYILVGLGNPGEKYEETRHNVGFKVIDRICQIFNIHMNQKNKLSEYTTLYLRLDDKQEKKELMGKSKKKRLESHHEIKNQLIEYLLIQQSKNQHINSNNSNNNSNNNNSNNSSNNSNNSNNNINQISDNKPSLIDLLNNLENLEDTLKNFRSYYESNLEKQQKEQQSNSIKPKKIIKQVILLKPTTFMNRSGGSVRNIATEFNVPIDNILVFHDEITTDVGDLKMKLNGGSGNHNGVQDVIDRLGSQKFARFRIGVGPKNNEPTAQFVLKRIPDEKNPLLKSAIEKASRHSIMWLEIGTKDYIELNI